MAKQTKNKKPVIQANKTDLKIHRYLIAIPVLAFLIKMIVMVNVPSGGWLGADGDGVWAIALRGAQLTKETLTAFAGCGIVAGSEAQAELEEAILKFKPIVDSLS